MKLIKPTFLVLALFALGLPGCGGDPYEEVGETPTEEDPSGLDDGDDGNDPNPIPSPTGTPWTPPCVYTNSCGDNGDDGDGDGDLPPAEYSFRLNDDNDHYWTTSLPRTDSILKIRVEAGRAGNLTDPKHSAFSFPYDCISYEITVRQADQENGRTVATQMLNAGNSNSYICGDAPTSQTINFNDRLTSGTDTNNLVVDIRFPQYSHRCQMWDDMERKWQQGLGAHPIFTMGGGVVGRDFFCDLVPVYRTHTVTGKIHVQVNGTSAL